MGVRITVECDDCGTEHELDLVTPSTLVATALPQGWMFTDDGSQVYPPAYCPDCKAAH